MSIIGLRYTRGQEPCVQATHAEGTPTSVCSRFADWDASILEHGASKPVKILIDGEFYEATLKNQNFDQRRYLDEGRLVNMS